MIFDASYFQARLEKHFLSAGQALQLVEVAPFGGQSAFSLVFRGPSGTPLPQQILTLERAGDDPIALFLVPIGRDASGVLYEAIFNN